MDMITVAIAIGFVLFLLILVRKPSSSTSIPNLPPGSFGWPLLGEILQFLAAQRANAVQEFYEQRIKLHGGDIFKTHFLGSPTAIFYSSEGNRFLFSNGNKLVQISWPSSLSRLFGNSIISKVGDEAKELRKLVLTFLKPEALQTFVGRVDSIISDHVKHFWLEERQIKAFHLSKRCLFAVACSLFLSMDEGTQQSDLYRHFIDLVNGTFLLRCLALNMDCYEKVLQEQMEITRIKEVSQVAVLQWDDLQKMKYTWRAAQETLRLYPPSGGTWRKAIADFSYAGFTIPRGWKLSWTTSSTHKNRKYFEDPEKLEGEAPAPYTFVPFGGGLRMYPGNEFARMVILVFVHNIVKIFEWDLINVNEKVIVDPLPTPADGLPINLRRRSLTN